MATFATSNGAASAPAFGLHPAGQHDHPPQQQPHLHHQVSQISLDQHALDQHALDQHTLQQQQATQLQNTQRQQQPVQPPADDVSAESAGSVKGSNGVSRGLGILNKLGLDRRTNRGKY